MGSISSTSCQSPPTIRCTFLEAISKRSCWSMVKAMLFGEKPTVLYSCWKMSVRGFSTNSWAM